MKRNVKIGDYIMFERKDKIIIGIVEIVRDNSVIVEIPKEAAMHLDYETNKTVVKHKNYTILKNSASA